MARLIAIDGLDGSGKGTQSQMLYDYLQARSERVRLLSFPTYIDPASALVKLYLSGGLGDAPEDTGAYASSVFFACDRYVSFRTDWQKEYERPDALIIANRYTTANAVHQLSKLPRQEWDAFLQWLWDFEFNRLALPAPDEVIYLEVPPALSERLVEERGREKDIHEKSRTHLENSYAAARYCAQRFGWKRVVCHENGVMRTREEIFSQIRGILNV